MNSTLADDLLAKAIALLDGKVAQIPHAAALSIAVHYGVTAYDARFLALAQQLGRPLVTEDAKLRAAAPGLTQSLNEALATANESR
jgi:predicted nucleic acid-binding protein